MNILRRASLIRLLLGCALAIALGACATALAFALGSGPTPPPKPLAQAIHDALSAAPVEGLSAEVTLTNHLLEGASLTSGDGQGDGLGSSPLLSGAAGRLWVAKDGRARLELQAEKGDTEILDDGHTLTIYDASSNTLYRYTPAAHEAASGEVERTETSADGSSKITSIVRPARAGSAGDREPPSVAKIEEGIAKLSKHAVLSGATPTDIAGQAAYTARISPKESGSLIGAAEISWDAVNGTPLRLALYSSTSSSPVIELAASAISYGPVAESVFQFTPPPDAKVQELKAPDHDGSAPGAGAPSDGQRPKLSTHGHGLTGVTVLEAKTRAGEKPLQLPEGLKKVKVNGTSAVELPTALGTLLSFERSGVRYLLLGAVEPQAIESVARGL